MNAYDGSSNGRLADTGLVNAGFATAGGKTAASEPRKPSKMDDEINAGLCVNGRRVEYQPQLASNRFSRQPHEDPASYHLPNDRMPELSLLRRSIQSHRLEPYPASSYIRLLDRGLLNGHLPYDNLQYGHLLTDQLAHSYQPNGYQVNGYLSNEYQPNDYQPNEYRADDHKLNSYQPNGYLPDGHHSSNHLSQSHPSNLSLVNMSDAQLQSGQISYASPPLHPLTNTPQSSFDTLLP